MSIIKAINDARNDIIGTLFTIFTIHHSEITDTDCRCITNGYGHTFKYTNL